MGLAAAGVISFAAVAQAEEKPTHQVLTAVSSTALSGYVSTSVSWAPGNRVPAQPQSYAKSADQFSLDVIDIKLSSALAEGEWASGYNVELWLGPDAGDFGNQIGNSGLNGGIAIKNANVVLNIPVGNGIQAKIGVFDSIIGYESSNSIENPNYTRSLGYTLEPFSHTGLLLTYKVMDSISVSAGMANTLGNELNQGARGTNSQWTYMAAVTVTAPDSLGFLKGASLTAGVVDGFNHDDNTQIPAIVGDTTHIYIGATVPTGNDKVNLGAAWDRKHENKSNVDEDVLAAYLSLKTSEKSTFNARLEYLNISTQGSSDNEALVTTLTFDYKLWANVVSRLEYRWQHDLNGLKRAATRNNVDSSDNSHEIIAQIAYKF